MRKRKKLINKWRKFLVVGLAVLIAGSSSLQGAVALEKDSSNRDKKVKNEIEKQENIQKYIPGQVIIKLKEGVSPDHEFLGKHKLKSAEKVLKGNKLEKNEKAEQAMKKHGLDRIYLAEFSLEEELTGVLERLNKDSRIEYAEPNYELTIDVIPDDPSFSQLWGLNNISQTSGTLDADIDAPEAWGIQTGSSDVVIAVIDTGVDYNHPDLAANIWTNLGEIPGNGEDDDGNGYTDDIHGYDFVNYDGDPMDDHYHGTHCAGTIGAVGNNGIGVVGVNWDVRIMPVKFLDSGGSGSTTGAIASVNYATEMGVDVMSNSWGGGGFSQALEDAISAANDAGILFVAAAGNDNLNNDIYPHYPSSYDVPNVVSVAATDHNDNRASFSCYGAESVDLGAPGVDIYSTKPNDNYGALDGTSMATPHVAGAAGLIKAEYPGLSAMGIKSMILDGVDPISALSGITVTGGRLNVYNSLSLSIDDISPAIVSDLMSLETTFNSASLSWTAVGDDGNSGTASFYDIRYSTESITAENWDGATRAVGEPSPQLAGSEETFEVTGLEFDTTYYFALKVMDDFGNQLGFSNVASNTTTVPTISFMDDMESGASGWTHGGTNDNWELGSPTSGPMNSNSGINAWATDLSGNYGVNNMNAWLASPSINLSGIESAQLVFQHYYYTENYYDGGIVEISTDGGASWAQITPEGGYPEDALSSGNPLDPVPAYSGYSGDGWHPAVFDISSYDGYSNINIRFRFGTDYSVNGYPGWYIDDVVIFGEFSGIGNPPVADAGGDQIGNVQEAVTFDGSASYDIEGPIVSYLWDFGDGTVGTGAIIDYIYQDGGIYNVTLVVLDQDGLSAQDVVSVTIYDTIPPAQIDDLKVLEITFDSVTLGWTAVGDDGSIGQAQTYDIRYSTNPIDESNFFDANEFFERPSPQPAGSDEIIDIWPLGSDTTYYFAIKVIDDVDNISPISNVEQATTPVFVNSPPVANAGPDQTVDDVNGDGSEMVTLDGSSSYDIELDGYIVSYKWFNDIGASPICFGKLSDCDFPVGTHIVTLVVTDNDGATATDTVDITVNQLPIANAGPDQTVNDTDGDGLEMVTLDGTKSSDPDGNIVSYTWSEGMTFVGNGPTPSYDFSVGTHIVVLVVQDNNGTTNSSTVTIEVLANKPPTANAEEDQTSVVGATVSFDGSGSTDPDGTIVSYNWEFGDGATGSGIYPTHIYSSYGDHIVTLTVTDNGGATATDTVIVTIEDAVTITAAVYDSKKDTLTIKATSSAGSEAILTASAGNFENVAMRYDSRLKVFKVTMRKVTLDPGSVTVSSSLGGESSANTTTIN